MIPELERRTGGIATGMGMFYRLLQLKNASKNLFLNAELLIIRNHLLLYTRHDGRMSQILHREFSLSLSHSSKLRCIC